MGRGIDYGMGTTNIDAATGIRFGVINMNALNEWAWEGVESDYGDPACPKCGGSVIDSDDAGEEFDADKDWFCEACEASHWSDMVYGDDPVGHTLDDGEYKASIGTDGDMMLVSSPFYTLAGFCSPCAPGAGHLESPCDDGVKTYCLNHDWFTDGKAPYTVFRVSDGSIVEPGK